MGKRKFCPKCRLSSERETGREGAREDTCRCTAPRIARGRYLCSRNPLICTVSLSGLSVPIGKILECENSQRQKILRRAFGEHIPVPLVNIYGVMDCVYLLGTYGQHSREKIG